jgi:hypothetical protein
MGSLCRAADSVLPTGINLGSKHNGGRLKFWALREKYASEFYANFSNNSRKGTELFFKWKLWWTFLYESTDCLQNKVFTQQMYSTFCFYLSAKIFVKKSLPVTKFGWFAGKHVSGVGNTARWKRDEKCNNQPIRKTDRFFTLNVLFAFLLLFSKRCRKESHDRQT